MLTKELLAKVREAPLPGRPVGAIHALGGNEGRRRCDSRCGRQGRDCGRVSRGRRLLDRCGHGVCLVDGQWTCVCAHELGQGCRLSGGAGTFPDQQPSLLISTREASRAWLKSQLLNRVLCQ